MDTIIVDRLHPERGLRLALEGTTKDRFMLIDVNDSRWPLNRFVESPAEIEQKTYDVDITHMKGVYVLRMIAGAIKTPTFYKGVNYYLTDNAYQPVTPADLHAGLQRAIDEDFPDNNLNIAAIMSPWENLAGYPLVTVRQEGSRLFLTQEGFTTGHDDLYPIPIFFTTASDTPSETTTVRFWMTNREMEVPPISRVEGDWIVLNYRNYGLYLTNYDADLWDKIIEALLDDIEVVNLQSRGLLFADFHKLIHHGHDVSSTIFLRLAMTLQMESEANVWSRAHPGLWRITNRLRATGLLDEHLSYLRNLMAPIHERLLNDESVSSELSEHVRFWSCLSGVQECLDNALSELESAMENGGIAASMCSGFMAANEAVWMHFWNFALQSSGSVRDQLLNDLSCTNDVDLLAFYLANALNTTNGLTSNQREIIINRVYEANFVGYDLILGFVDEHHEFIQSE